MSQGNFCHEFMHFFGGKFLNALAYQKWQISSMDTSDVNVSPLILVIKSISISFVVQSASSASVFYIQSIADDEKVSEMQLNQWKITHLIPMHACFSFLCFLLVSFLKESFAKGFEKFSVNCRSQICWAKNPDPRGEEPFQLKKAKQSSF